MVGPTAHDLYYDEDRNRWPEEFPSCCGYCGSVIDYCQGHGEDERSEYGFDYDSDEYDARREVFEEALLADVE
tara:strand:+ start:1067 stop:1285 length:219 start_codon:yes stop_codon:yes gene_type:complete